MGTSAAAMFTGACQVSTGSTISSLATAAVTSPSLFTGKSLGEADEINIGNQLYGQTIDMQGGAYRNSKVQAAISQFADPIIAASSRTTLPWEITVVDDNAVNAWALPGGKIGVNKGLLRYVANEHELAAVLSHEIGHIEHAHALNEMKSGQMAGTVKNVLANIASDSVGGGLAGQLTGKMIDELAPYLTEMAITGYSRSNEIEADSYIFTSFAKSGHDPQKSPDFFRTLLELIPPSSDDVGTTSLFSNHPVTRERIAALEEQMLGLKQSGTPRNPGFNDLRRTFPLREYHLRTKATG